MRSIDKKEPLPARVENKTHLHKYKVRVFAVGLACWGYATKKIPDKQESVEVFK